MVYPGYLLRASLSYWTIALQRWLEVEAPEIQTKICVYCDGNCGIKTFSYAEAEPEAEGAAHLGEENAEVRGGEACPRHLGGTFLFSFSKECYILSDF